MKTTKRDVTAFLVEAKEAVIFLTDGEWRRRQDEFTGIPQATSLTDEHLLEKEFPEVIDGRPYQIFSKTEKLNQQLVILRPAAGNFAAFEERAWREVALGMRDNPLFN